MRTVRLKEQKGFTLVELMVALVVFGLAMAAATSSFMPLVGHFTQQSKIAETQMESVISIDVLREDIEHAGYGLPMAVINVEDGDKGSVENELWDELASYQEAASGKAVDYNDADSGNPPRPLAMGNDVGKAPVESGTGINESDYLVIRSASVRNFSETGKWTYMTMDQNTNQIKVRKWHEDEMDMRPDTLVIATKMMSKMNSNLKRYKPLVTSTDTAATGQYFFKFGDLVEAPNLITDATEIEPFWYVKPTAYTPPEASETYLIYAVGDGSDNGDGGLRMPFNRADYYINDKNVPLRCAKNPGADGILGTNDDRVATGVLTKAVVSHVDGTFGSYIPLFDCVADMQIVFGLDMDENGTIGTYTDGFGFDSSEGFAEEDVKRILNGPGEEPPPGFRDQYPDLLWKRLREVRIYILAHEGQRDPGYSFQTKNGDGKIDVGYGILGHVELNGNAFDLKTIVGDPEYKYYRWIVYSMVIKPTNMVINHKEK